MKKIIRILTLMSVVVAFASVSVFASKTTNTFEANIPFDFTVNQKSYKAGSYVIRVTEVSQSASIIALEDEKGNQLEKVMGGVSGDMNKGEPVLVFNRYENQRFLAKIVTAKNGLVMPTSKTEKQIVKKMKEGTRRTEVAGLTIK